MKADSQYSPRGIAPLVELKNGVNKIGSFKLGYTWGVPSHLVPKIFDNKKDEEYFVTSLYAGGLCRSKVKVIDWEVCGDDSNKGPDTILRYDGGEVSIQITRFTLTKFIQRRKVAEKRVHGLIDEIFRVVRPRFPVNITVTTPDMSRLPIYKPMLDKALASEIASVLKLNLPKMEYSRDPVQHVFASADARKIAITMMIERIPNGAYSNFFGKQNLFINYDFDNVGYTKEDLEYEANEIFAKKNNGKADVLIIWSEAFETLYNHEQFADVLRKYCSNSTFGQILFFSFYNRVDLFLNWGLKADLLKQD